MSAICVDYLRVLHKRRWTAVTAFLIVLVGVTVYTFTATPLFEARTRLLIEADNPNVVSFKEVIDEQGTKADYYQTQYNILQSRALARKTLDSLQLWDDTRFARGRRRLVRAPARPRGFCGRPFDKLRAGVRGTETVEQSRAIDRFLGNLTVSPIRNSRLVDVKYQPRRSGAGVAHRERAREELHRAEPRVQVRHVERGERLARRAPRRAAQAGRAGRDRAAAVPRAERRDLARGPREHRRPEAVRPERRGHAGEDRALPEGGVVQAAAVADAATPPRSTPSRRSSATPTSSSRKRSWRSCSASRRQLSEKLGDKHPDIIKVRAGIPMAQTKLEGEIAKVVQSVRNEYQAALAKENSLIAALNQQKAEAQAMNRKAIDYGVLERDVQSTKQLYESLLQRAKETGVSTELKTSNIRVVDEAERPRVPVSPRKALNLSLALFGGSLPRLRPRVLLRVRGQPDQDARRNHHLPRPGVARDGARPDAELVARAPSR